MHVLVWLRRDLRLGDNPALSEALRAAQAADTTTGQISAVYIDCPKQWDEHNVSPAQRDFIARTLVSLEQDLARANIPLHRLTCPTFADVPKLLADYCQQGQIGKVFANREPEVNEQRRDQAVSATLSIPLELHNADCTVPPGRLLTGSGEMYKVFTPFSKAWLREISVAGYSLLPPPVPPQAMDSHPDWPAGEAAALARLESFVDQGLLEYGEERDLPAIDGTSRLSAYLAIGVLSTNQCLAVIQQQLGYLPLSRGEQGFTWLNELIWREFYRHLLVAYPRLSMSRAFKPETEQLAWSQSTEDFERWCEGQTGFPIVDAAMRCLNQTNWMHNRLRMIVASFLTKDLHIDWRWGEAYFMQQLIDGDLASNNGGWQWSASTGADAAPYFRIFNPKSQSERFDSDGSFIRRWVPELAKVPVKQIHAPRDWLDQNDPANSYPHPMVDHKQAREQTLSMFKALAKH